MASAASSSASSMPNSSGLTSQPCLPASDQYRARPGDGPATVDSGGGAGNGGGRLLVAKTDPVTFASDHIGWYTVHVNANDIACMGARPAWFLATVLLPEGASERQAEEIFGAGIDAGRGGGGGGPRAPPPRYFSERGISVVQDARGVCGAVPAAGGTVHAMHDPT